MDKPYGSNNLEKIINQLILGLNKKYFLPISKMNSSFSFIILSLTNLFYLY